MEIRLLVIRTSDPKRLSIFYNMLGFVFDYHQHGNSPYHYSTSIGNMVLEIYPLAKRQELPDKNLRLGFEVDDFENVLITLKENQVVFTEPVQTDFGFLSVITDPDGRKIELYKQ